MKIFGKKPEEENIIFRKGAYGIIYKDGLVAIVKNPLGYFLLGGGHEELESDEECILREVREEIGSLAIVGKFLDRVQEFVHVKEWEKTYCKDMSIYVIELANNIDGKIEYDHELVWVTPMFAIENLYLSGQSYVLKKYIERD